MIELIKTVTGQEVPKLNGYFLSSSYDPLTEAERWIESVQHNLQDTVCILGVGAGLHIKLLAERNPQRAFYVFDFNHEICQRFNEKLGQPENVEVICLNNSNDILNEELYKKLIFLKPQIFTFRPACQVYMEEFSNLYLHLSLRSKMAFARFTDFLKDRELKKIQFSNQTIHIKEFVEATKSLPPDSFWRKTTALLKELIK